MQTKIDAAIEGRVVLTMVAMGAMVVVLVTFAIVARKTFGKPWYQWATRVRNKKI